MKNEEVCCIFNWFQQKRYLVQIKNKTAKVWRTRTRNLSCKEKISSKSKSIRQKVASDQTWWADTDAWCKPWAANTALPIFRLPGVFQDPWERCWWCWPQDLQILLIIFRAGLTTKEKILVKTSALSGQLLSMRGSLNSVCVCEFCWWELKIPHHLNHSQDHCRFHKVHHVIVEKWIFT